MQDGDDMYLVRDNRPRVWNVSQYMVLDVCGTYQVVKASLYQKQPLLSSKIEISVGNSNLPKQRLNHHKMRECIRNVMKEVLTGLTLAGKFG